MNEIEEETLLLWDLDLRHIQSKKTEINIRLQGKADLPDWWFGYKMNDVCRGKIMKYSRNLIENWKHCNTMAGFHNLDSWNCAKCTRIADGLNRIYKRCLRFSRQQNFTGFYGHREKFSRFEESCPAICNESHQSSRERFQQWRLNSN